MQFGMAVHYCLNFKVNLPKPKQMRKTVKYRNTMNINLNALKTSIEDLEVIEKIKTHKNVDDQVNVFNREL